MAGDWIKLEKATADKPEVLRMARALKLDRDSVFGKLLRVWIWFDGNSVDGNVDGAVDADVDALVSHSGFADAMRNVGWLTDTESGAGLQLPKFDRHNGETAKKRALKNNRQTNWRQKKDAQASTPASTSASTREEKRRVTTPIVPLPGDDLFPDGFARFWEIWPAGERKQAKGKCAEVWKRRNCEAIADEILAHVESLKRTDSWHGGFVPAPLVYLNQARWQGATLQAVEEKRVAL